MRTPERLASGRHKVRFRLGDRQTSETFDRRKDAVYFCVSLDTLGPQGALDRLYDGQQDATVPALDGVAAAHIEHLTGVEDGTRIRLSGEGEAGVRGGPAGDLYIFLSLATHEFFQRDGADLHCRVPISMVTASLGGEFEVPTIERGKTKVKVPSGTQSGRRFRVASKGMPVLRSRQMGDMYVQVVVETPQNLTKKQQELLAEFEKLSSGATQPEAAGFFTKVKDFFGTRAGS
jgi:hypothetical protein